MIRFIGFQGKRSIEALFDPALNSILAHDQGARLKRSGVDSPDPYVTG